MLITRSDDGYFGLMRSLFGVFSDAVSSSRNLAIERHCVTEDDHSVAQDFVRTVVFPKKNPGVAPQAGRKSHNGCANQMYPGRASIWRHWRMIIDPCQVLYDTDARAKNLHNATRSQLLAMLKKRNVPVRSPCNRHEVLP